MIKISVIIPTYNPQFYIGECLESLYRQDLSFEKWEIIIILNGDIVTYKPIINSYINNKPKDCTVRLLCTNITGVSNARNIGLENALGDYICFIDDDDIVSVSYLSRLLQLANNNVMPISNIYSFKHNINEKRNNFFICEKIRKKNFSTNASMFANRSFFSFPVGKLIHKNIINERRFDLRFKNGEDALFMTTITDKIDNIVYVEDVIYYVREREGSATRRKIPSSELITSMFKLIGAYIYTYLKKPIKYNLFLFLSRIPGVVKNILILARNK